MANITTNADAIGMGSERPFTCPSCGSHNWHPNTDLTLRCVNCGWNTK